MSYLNNAVNGTDGAFVDRAIAQLKQADVDVAEWDRANRQLAQRLLTRRCPRKHVEHDHRGTRGDRWRAAQARRRVRCPPFREPEAR